MMSESNGTIQYWKRLCTDHRTQSAQLRRAAYWEAIKHARMHDIRALVAKHANADPQLLATLAQCDHLPTMISVAAHHNLSERTAGTLMKLQCRTLRKTLASNPQTPAWVMMKLARDHAEVRYILARNMNLHPDAMTQLTRTSRVKIRKRLAKHPGLRGKALKRLLKDPEPAVRARLAFHPNVRGNYLLYLARSKEAEVLWSVLDRAMRDFPKWKPVFEALAKCVNSEVTRQAKRYLANMDQIAPKTIPNISKRSKGRVFTYHKPREVLEQADSITWDTTELWDSNEITVTSDDDGEETHLLCLGTCKPEPVSLEPLNQIARNLQHKLSPMQLMSMDFFSVPNKPSGARLFVAFSCPADNSEQVTQFVRIAVGQITANGWNYDSEA